MLGRRNLIEGLKYNWKMKPKNIKDFSLRYTVSSATCSKELKSDVRSLKSFTTMEVFGVTGKEVDFSKKFIFNENKNSISKLPSYFLLRDPFIGSFVIYTKSTDYCVAAVRVVGFKGE
jgi:hypothetical protein